MKSKWRGDGGKVENKKLNPPTCFVYKFNQDQQQEMKKLLSLFRFPFSTFILLMIIAISCTTHDHKNPSVKAGQYTCPMHPQIVEDKPGTCPICGMDLVKKGQTGEAVKITAELTYLLKPTNAMVISSIKTITPLQKEMELTTYATGLITYDTRRFTSVPIRFGGRIEKLLIKYNLQPIRRGQKILEIYSPELLTAQRDLLYLLKSDKENSPLIEGAKEKLRLLGASDAQITQLATMQESYSFAVHSPADGYIVEEAALTAAAPSGQPQNSSSMDGGMASGNSLSARQTPATLSGSELLTREGMYVSTGQVLFKIVNTEQVWAEFDVYQQDAAFINVNDLVQLTFDNTIEKMEAKVNFIQPFFKSGERFMKVRVYLPNTTNKFRIGQLAKASFTKPSKDLIWIPITARLDLGTKEIAFVKRRGAFRPTEIVTARQSADWIEVRSGVEVSDSLAYNAQFMVDSESFIKVKSKN
jgi:membrane fusion protein, copper/silver efflux system